MKVHIVLKGSVLDSAQEKQTAFERVTALGVNNINMRRFERYGIISGDIESNQLNAIKNLREVEAVEVDGKKFIRR